MKIKNIYIDANNLYGLAMSEYLPYDNIKFDKNVSLEDILNTPNDNEIGYFVECDLSYLDNIKEKTKFFPFCPENKLSPQDKFTIYLNQMKPDRYTPCKNLICDWTDKKIYLVHCRLLKFYVRLGTIVDKVHEIISFKQNNWLEKYIDFHVKKRAEDDNNKFQIEFHKTMSNSFYGKCVENAGNRCIIEFIKKDDEQKIIKQQSKLTFNGIHNSYTNYDSYTFKQNEILMDKPIYLGFAVLEEVSKLHKYETFYDKLKSNFGEKNIKLHYMDTDSFVLSINIEFQTIKYILIN